MISKSRTATLLKSAIGVLALILTPSAMYACPVCYQAAASAGGRFFHALQLGIAVALPFPFLLAGMIAYMAYRRRDRYIDSADPLSSANPLID
jgi:hypothetical protein